MTHQDRRQARTLREMLRIAIPLVLAWSAGLAVMAMVASQPDTRAGELLMDPSFTIGAKWYTGLVSNLGILSWTVGAAAAFAGAWLCRLGQRQRAGRFLFGGGVVGTMLLLDDLFQFHAVLVPAQLNMPKIVGELVLGGALLYWAMSHLREIRRTHIHLLLAAGAGLAVSFFVDSRYAPSPGQGWNIIEDGAKFLGVLAWATYFVVTTKDISRSVFVDALMTWPDAAYDSVYGALEEMDLEPELPAPTGEPVDLTTP
ncbi:MAG: hypothetical protein U0Q22_18515 [Acidimicrobiales bacterium]